MSEYTISSSAGPAIAATLSGLPCFECLKFASEALGMIGAALCPLRAALDPAKRDKIILPIGESKSANCPEFEPG